MKKLFLSAILAIAGFVSAQAQVYVGGSVGVWCDNSGPKNETTWNVLPEVGYYFNDKWAAGIEVGFSGGHLQDWEGDNAFAFRFNPYARYSFFNNDKVDLFCEGAIGVAIGNHNSRSEVTGWKDSETAFSIGLRPGIKINLTDNWSLISKLGFLGYSANDDYVVGAYQPGFGFTFDNELYLGVYYSL